MVRHIGAHDGDVFAFGQPGAGVIQRFVETVRSPAAGFGQSRKVVRGRGRIDHGRQRGGIRRDDDIFAEAALEPQPGHTKAGILVREVEVAHIVCRLRHSPGQAALRSVGDVPTHDQFARLVQQAAHRRTHHQLRHQVFEHRARPRDERGTATHRRKRAVQAKPVRRRNVALGDGDEAREARLRSEKVVTAGIQAAVCDAVADGKQLARMVKQKVEIHRAKHALRRLCDRRKAANERGGIRGRMPHGLGQRIDPRQCVTVRRRIVEQACAQRNKLTESGLTPFRSVRQRGNGMEERRNRHPLGRLV